MNIPAPSAKIQRLAEPMLPAHTPTIIPMRQSTEETQLYISAFRTDMPALSSTAKSPVEQKEIVVQLGFALHYKELAWQVAWQQPLEERLVLSG